MGLFSFGNTKPLIAPDESEQVIKAIKEAERNTSGEVRIFVESRCKYLDPLDRAAEIFWSLKMDQTLDRNGVLIYIAMKDHQYAIYGDKGIYEKLGTDFWKNEVDIMGRHFRENHFVEAMTHVIHDIGDVLSLHFPYAKDVDKNELPDDIVFGH